MSAPFHDSHYYFALADTPRDGFSVFFLSFSFISLLYAFTALLVVSLFSLPDSPSFRGVSFSFSLLNLSQLQGEMWFLLSLWIILPSSSVFRSAYIAYCSMLSLFSFSFSLSFVHSVLIFLFILPFSLISSVCLDVDSGRCAVSDDSSSFHSLFTFIPLRQSSSLRWSLINCSLSLFLFLRSWIVVSVLVSLLSLSLHFRLSSFSPTSHHCFLLLVFSMVISSFIFRVVRVLLFIDIHRPLYSYLHHVSSLSFSLTLSSLQSPFPLNPYSPLHSLL